MTPGCTRTSRSPSSRTRFPGCTAGTRRSASAPRTPATGTATSRWTRESALGVPAVAGADPPGQVRLPGRHPPPALADAAGQAGGGGVRSSRRTVTGGPLGVAAGARRRRGRPADVAAAYGALGLPAPGNAEHTEVFVLNCPPYAAIYLGADGGLGGDAADRVAALAGHRGRPPAGRSPRRAAEPVREPRRSLLRRRKEAVRHALTRARRALFWEHLWPWLPAYLAAVEAFPALGAWAALTRRAVLAERAGHPGPGGPDGTVPGSRWRCAPPLPRCPRTARKATCRGPDHAGAVRPDSDFAAPWPPARRRRARGAGSANGASRCAPC